MSLCARVVYGLFAFLAATACTRTLDGARCPCFEGYVCCVAEDRCIEGNTSCPADLACGAVEGPECGAHGRCEQANEGAAAACACDEGYDDEACTTCAPGYEAKGDGCVLACPMNCGDHAHCTRDTGTPACVCDDQYAGPDCSACAQGYTVNTDGVCEAGCTPCPEHAGCDLASPDRACACVTGYVAPSPAEVALSCVWQGHGDNGGGIRDPGFEDEGAWEAEGVSFDPDAFGQGDQGASFDDGAACGGGSLSQLIQMPARNVAEPLVLVVRGSLAPIPPNACFTSEGVRVGESETKLSFDTNTNTLRMCLGDAGYGPDVRVTLVPYASVCPSHCIARVYEQLDIVAAEPDECPFGPIVNGDFVAAAGWTLENTLPEALTVGDGLLSLLSYNSDDFLYASQVVHVPRQAGTALRITFQNYASDGDPVLVQLDEKTLFQLRLAAGRASAATSTAFRVSFAAASGPCVLRCSASREPRPGPTSTKCPSSTTRPAKQNPRAFRMVSSSSRSTVPGCSKVTACPAPRWLTQAAAAAAAPGSPARRTTRDAATSPSRCACPTVPNASAWSSTDAVSRLDAPT